LRGERGKKEKNAIRGGRASQSGKKHHRPLGKKGKKGETDIAGKRASAQKKQTERENVKEKR